MKLTLVVGVSRGQLTLLLICLEVAQAQRLCAYSLSSPQAFGKLPTGSQAGNGKLCPSSATVLGRVGPVPSLHSTAELTIVAGEQVSLP